MSEIGSVPGGKTKDRTLSGKRTWRVTLMERVWNTQPAATSVFGAGLCDPGAPVDQTVSGRAVLVLCFGDAPFRPLPCAFSAEAWDRGSWKPLAFDATVIRKLRSALSRFARWARQEVFRFLKHSAE